MMSSTYDRADRPDRKTWPTDPDFGGGGPAPVIEGRIRYNWRSLPSRTDLYVDGVDHMIIRAAAYNEY
ncbi:MAG: hypothetical protein GY772_13260, partial [bacterium]|nr:hypothetical protein [bacterium]